MRLQEMKAINTRRVLWKAIGIVKESTASRICWWSLLSNDWNLCILSGGSIIGESSVIADETPITLHCVETKEESPIVEERKIKLWKLQGWMRVSTKVNLVLIEASQPEKKEDEPVAPKEEKASSKPEETV